MCCTVHMYMYMYIIYMYNAIYNFKYKGGEDFWVTCIVHMYMYIVDIMRLMKILGFKTLHVHVHCKFWRC